MHQIEGLNLNKSKNLSIHYILRKVNICLDLLFII